MGHKDQEAEDSRPDSLASTSATSPTPNTPENPGRMGHVLSLLLYTVLKAIRLEYKASGGVQMSLFERSYEPIMVAGGDDAMAVPVDRVARILGLRSNVRSVADIAEAVESGLPKQSLERVVERSGIEALLASSSCPRGSGRNVQTPPAPEARRKRKDRAPRARHSARRTPLGRRSRSKALPRHAPRRARQQEADRSRAHRTRGAPSEGRRHARTLRAAPSDPPRCGFIASPIRATPPR